MFRATLLVHSPYTFKGMVPEFTTRGPVQPEPCLAEAFSECRRVPGGHHNTPCAPSPLPVSGRGLLGAPMPFPQPPTISVASPPAPGSLQSAYPYQLSYHQPWLDPIPQRVAPSPVSYGSPQGHCVLPGSSMSFAAYGTSVEEATATRVLLSPPRGFLDTRVYLPTRPSTSSLSSSLPGPCDSPLGRADKSSRDSTPSRCSGTPRECRKGGEGCSGVEASGSTQLPLYPHPPCDHKTSWKRLRGKRGFGYFLCLECHAKWKTQGSARADQLLA